MIALLMSLLRSRALIFLHDLAWVPISLHVAYLLRFSPGVIPAQFHSGYLWMLAAAVPAFSASFWLFGLHRGVWRYISFPDLLRLLKSVLLGTLVLALFILVLRRAEGIPRSVIFLLPLVLTVGLAGPRVIFRWLCEQGYAFGRPQRRRALIVGAGQVGELLIRRLLRDGQIEPAALVDPDPRMAGKEIHGVRVVGGLDQARRVIREQGIAVLILAHPDAGPAELNDLVADCAKARIPCRTVPQRAVSEDGAVDDIKLRPITIEDLLRRDPVTLNLAEISQHLAGQSVLVTGGGGSIGSELCLQIAAKEPASLIVFDSSEFNLYRIEQDLRGRFPKLPLHALLGDVKDEPSIDALFRRYRPRIVFHAAAYKHVPLLEGNALQGVQNNVMGTRIVADAANRHGSTQFVLISTDKAVNPTNVMGATKRIAELYCQSLNATSHTHYLTTRFGNVLGSVGSVVPLFEAQIAQGGPVTVTHPEIRRYFMTISEAVSLILQASAMGRGGEIFVLDMGDPVRIKDLAEQMIRLAGFAPYEDIPIVFTGLRAGEKLYEELIHEQEEVVGTSNPKILLAAHRQVIQTHLDDGLAALDRAAVEGRWEDILPCIRQLVPEFTGGAGKPPEEPAPGAPHLRVVPS